MWNPLYWELETYENFVLRSIKQGGDLCQFDDKKMELFIETSYKIKKL